MATVWQAEQLEIAIAALVGATTSDMIRSILNAILIRFEPFLGLIAMAALSATADEGASATMKARVAASSAPSEKAPARSAGRPSVFATAAAPSFLPVMMKV